MKSNFWNSESCLKPIVKTEFRFRKSNLISDDLFHKVLIMASRFGKIELYIISIVKISRHTRNGVNRDVSEEGGELLSVHRSRSDDQLEILSSGDDVSEKSE